jgi:hypothetical protein
VTGAHGVPLPVEACTPMEREESVPGPRQNRKVTHAILMSRVRRKRPSRPSADVKSNTPGSA